MIEPSDKAEAHEAINVLILSVHEDMGIHFVQTVCPDAAGGVGQTMVEGQRFNLNVFAGDPEESDEWKTKLDAADAVVIQVRFMDAISMERIRKMCQHLPTAPAKPLGVFLLREEGEIDFKMSCPSCGQKLWVRDTDEGKRGRCPNCKKAFRLPAQALHTKSELGLTDTISVTRVTRGNPTSCRSALSTLKGYIQGGLVATDSVVDSEILMKSTVRIDVESDDTLPGTEPEPEQAPEKASDES